MKWKDAVETRPDTYDSSGAETLIIMGSVFMVIVAALMAMWADYSGILRYLIMLTAIALALMVPAYLLFKESAVSTVREPEYHRPKAAGELEETSDLVKRALRGYHASQVLLEDRLRQALIDRVSIKRRMPVEKVRELSKSRKGAMALVGDPDLARLLSERKGMSRGKKVLFIRSSKEYRDWIYRVIEKMEEWK